MAITNPQLRSRSDQIDILLSIAERLREHEKLNNQNVVVSDQPVPEQMPGGAYCVTVSAGDGRFPGELNDAAHHAQMTEDGSVVVAIYSKIRRSRVGRKEAELLGRKGLDDEQVEQSRPSLLIWKREILKLLLVDDPSLADTNNVPYPTMRHAWEPQKSGIPLCRDQLRPISCTGPLDVPQFPEWLGMNITFSVAWDWDLYS